MKTTVVTDSTSDLTPELIAGADIEIVPLPITFGTEQFMDGVSLTRRNFYTKLASSKDLPTTTPPSTEQFAEIFKKIIDRGNDVVCPVVSSGLSQTYDNAVAAAKSIAADRIFVVDTKTFSGGLALHAIIAADAVKRGMAAGQIAQTLESYRAKQHGLCTLPDLTFLGRTGRLNKAQVMLGTMMKVTPVLKVDNATGKVEGEAQARSFEKAQELIVDIALRFIPNPLRTRILVGHCNSPQVAAAMEGGLRNKLTVPPKTLTIYEAGPSVAVNSGPGSVAIFSLEE